MPDKSTSKQLWHWKPGLCPRFDELSQDMVEDFCLPDPVVERYTVKMNWYPDGLSRVSPHRHDNWTLLLSLGSPRVLTVDRANVLMEDGDVILFGTQSHGVPEMPSCTGGRLSVVLMFAPDPLVGTAANTRLLSEAPHARRRGKPPSLPTRPTKSVEDLCPKGHALIDTPLRPGAKATCNGCGRQLEGGQQVMMCRPCNFGLCADCHLVPQDETLDLESATVLTNLCGLGFAYEDAQAALKAAGGNAEQAASLLLAASELEIDAERRPFDIDDQVGPIVID
jgi:hypothetical protein